MLASSFRFIIHIYIHKRKNDEHSPIQGGCRTVMLVSELRALCKANGIRGYSKLRKAALLAFIKSYNIPLCPLKSTNESFGINMEIFICELYNIKYPEHMLSRQGPRTRAVTTHGTRIHHLFDRIRVYPTLFIGNTNGPTDFLLSSGETLSVKTNFRNDKVCPQKIGQTTRQAFDIHFGVTGDRKQFIIEHAQSLLQEYFVHLFCCDYLLWILPHQCYLLKKRIVFPTGNITFTRDVSNWKESTTIKVDAISIGEFQVHQHRNCVKFRFKMRGLEKLMRTRSLQDFLQ